MPWRAPDKLWRSARARGAGHAAQPLRPSPHRTEDLISAVEFDSTGAYLATGDHSGRVVVFEPSNAAHKREQLEAGEEPAQQSPAEYRFLCEFQSHEPEFDYLKSLEIEARGLSDPSTRRALAARTPLHTLLLRAGAY